jgi:hypothetical protein
VQVDPIKPTLKSPGTKCLKLKYDGSLLNSAFKFSLRRYNLGSIATSPLHELVLAPLRGGFTGAVFDLRLERSAGVPLTAAAFRPPVNCPPTVGSDKP